MSTYKSVLMLFCKWMGNPELSEVTDERVDEYLAYLMTIYKERTRCLAANSIRAFFKHWSAKDKSDVSWELIQGPRITETFPDFVTQEMFDMIDEVYDEDNFEQLTRKVIFHLLWNTGMRISELMSLNISDIRADRNHTHITTLKTKKLRMVMWNDECHRLLMKYLGVRLCLDKGEELFQTPANRRNRGCRTRMTPRSVQRWCRELKELLGFEIRLRPHAFRHGKCHAIINGGGNIHQIQTIAGHSSVTSSEIYVRLNLKEQGELLHRHLPKVNSKGKKLHKVDSPYVFKA